MLPTAVIFCHASQLSKPGSESIAHKTTIGTVAVYGFFAISGYLIAGSATPNVYGWLSRVAVPQKIIPAFSIRLIVVAFVFGLVAGDYGEGCGRY